MSTVTKLNEWRPKPAAPEKEPPPARKKRSLNPGSRATLLRTLKLGEKAMKKIRGTSLDSAEELDELVVLNRGAAEGELTPVVRQLVEDAAAGKEVSAVAASNAMGARRLVTTTLVAAWRKRMVSTWEQATEADRTKFVAALCLKFELNKRAALLDYLMEHVPTTEGNP